jgi:hypothetical protein
MSVIARVFAPQPQKCLNEALRRLLSILLLAVFGMPFISPLFAMTAKAESNLPACCRRNGKHHCTMGVTVRSRLTNQSPEFQAPLEKCPYCPASVAVVHCDTFGPPTHQAIFAELIAHPAGTAQTESKLRISRSRSRQKRGPPASITL